jgi:hypothetical protein
MRVRRKREREDDSRRNRLQLITNNKKIPAPIPIENGAQQREKEEKSCG